MWKRFLNCFGCGGVEILLAVSLFVILLLAQPAKANGTFINAEERGRMKTAMQNTLSEPECPALATPEPGRISCPIKTPGQLIEEALDEQLKGAP